MIEMPGTRRITSEASLSCVLLICCADTPFCTTRLCRCTDTSAFSVLRFASPVTVATPRTASFSSMRITTIVSAFAGLTLTDDFLYPRYEAVMV